MARAQANGAPREGDPLKLYTLVMGLLALVMGVLWFVIDGTRKDYATSNERLEKAMAFEGRDRPKDEPPRSIPDLAWEVEALANAFGEASGTVGSQRSISQQMMDTVATQVGLRQSYASQERTDKSQKYETVSQRFEYTGMDQGPPEVWRLLGLLWNIESRGRYRVSEVSWQVADKTENPQPPFDRIKKPQVTVSLRGPVLE